MTTKFAKYGDRNRKSQTFDRKNIFVEKCGKKINCYDAIQAANIDTNIYEVMKKYHCTEDQAAEYMKEKGGVQGVYADIRELQTKMQDIGDAIGLVQTAQQMFENLPVEVRKKYGHNLEVFLKEQEKARKAEETSKGEKVDEAK